MASFWGKSWQLLAMKKLTLYRLWSLYLSASTEDLSLWVDWDSNPEPIP
jgi:hypothetical protein